MLLYWCGVLMFGKASHPWTYDLMEIALRIAQFQAMHYKRMANKAKATDKEGRGRPRPSQLSPALMPPIEVPGHASYPSGHATEAYLISKCLAEVMPAAASTPYDQPRAGHPGDPESTPLQRLAQRVARNREVLGLHYKSDSLAGMVLATHTFGILMACPTIKNVVIPNAKDEWKAPQY
jgi:membrane-associated phospholipid phosphatase